MRDIKRIDRICKRLAELWKYHPNQRFGQLLSNYLFNDGDPFYREDCREPWMSGDYLTWEDKIINEIKNIQLYLRVVEETNYEKDYENYWKKYSKWMKENPMKWDKVKGTAVYVNEKQTPEPKAPEWKDYIKELKNEKTK